jgi:hypothetical protein
MIFIIRAIIWSVWYALKTVYYVMLETLDSETSKKNKEIERKERERTASGSNVVLMFQINGNRLDGFTLDKFNTEPLSFDQTIPASR